MTTPDWEEFVSENLTRFNVFSGLCLLSKQREVIFSYGSLKLISEGDIEQFFITFCGRETDECYRSFSLSVTADSGSKTRFRIYHRTLTSIYATSAGNQSGLTVSKLQHGLFLTLFHKSTASHDAISLVERFADKLRF